MIYPPFSGFGPGVFEFFAGLEADNSKAYFEARREFFEAEVKGPLTLLLEEAAEQLGGRVKVYRQNRDIRFSKDKSPYKLSTYGAVQVPDGPSYYAAIRRSGFYAGTGRYEMDAKALARMRTAIDRPEGAALQQALDGAEAAGLVRWRDADLATAPRGVARDHPRIHLMRMRQLVTGAALPPEAALAGRAPLDHALQVWEAAAPLNAWIGAHVGWA